MRSKMPRSRPAVTLLILWGCSSVIWASPTTPIFDRSATGKTQKYDIGPSANDIPSLSPVPEDSRTTSSHVPSLLNYNARGDSNLKSQIDKQNARPILHLYIPERGILPETQPILPQKSYKYTLPSDTHPIWPKIHQKLELGEPLISPNRLTSSTDLQLGPYAPYYQPSWDSGNPWDRLLYYRWYGSHTNRNCPPYWMANNYFNRPNSNIEESSNPGFGYYDFDTPYYYGTAYQTSGLQSSNNNQHSGFSNKYQFEEATAVPSISEFRPYVAWPQVNSYQSVSSSSSGDSIPVFGNALNQQTNEKQHFTSHLYQPTNVHYGSTELSGMASYINGQNPPNNLAVEVTSSILAEKNKAATGNTHQASNHNNKDELASTVTSNIHHYTQTTQFVGGVEQESSSHSSKPQETSGSQHLVTETNFQPTVETQILNFHPSGTVSTSHNATEVHASEENQTIGIGGTAHVLYQLQGQSGMQSTTNMASQQTLESASFHSQMASSVNYGSTSAPISDKLQIIQAHPEMLSTIDHTSSNQYQTDDKISHSATSTINTDIIQSSSAETKPQIMPETTTLTNVKPHDIPQPGILIMETGNAGIQNGAISIENIESHQGSSGIVQSNPSNLVADVYHVNSAASSTISATNSTSHIPEQQEVSVGGSKVSGDASMHSESNLLMVNHVKPEPLVIQPGESIPSEVSDVITDSKQSNNVMASTSQLSGSSLHQSVGHITHEHNTAGVITETIIGVSSQGFIEKHPEPVQTPDHNNFPYQSISLKPGLIDESFIGVQNQAVLTKPYTEHHGEHLLEQESLSTHEEKEDGKLSTITSSSSTTCNYTSAIPSSETENSKLKGPEGSIHTAQPNTVVASTHTYASDLQLPQKVNSSKDQTATHLVHSQTDGAGGLVLLNFPDQAHEMLSAGLQNHLTSSQNFNTVGISTEHGGSSITSQDKVNIVAIKPEAESYYLQEAAFQHTGDISKSSETINNSFAITVDQISQTQISTGISDKKNESIYQLHPNPTAEASVVLESVSVAHAPENIPVIPVITSGDLEIVPSPELEPVTAEHQQFTMHSKETEEQSTSSKLQVVSEHTKPAMHSQIDGLVSVSIAQEQIPTKSSDANKIQQMTPSISTASGQKGSGFENVGVHEASENNHFIPLGQKPNLSVNNPSPSFMNKVELTTITQQSLIKPHQSSSHNIVNNHEHKIAVGATTSEQLSATTNIQHSYSSGLELAQPDVDKKPISIKNQGTITATYQQSNTIFHPAETTFQQVEKIQEIQYGIHNESSLTPIPPQVHEESHKIQQLSTNIMAESALGTSIIEVPSAILHKPANQILPLPDGIDIHSVNPSLMNSQNNYISTNQFHNTQQLTASKNPQQTWQSNSEREGFQANQYVSLPAITITHQKETSEEIHSHLKPVNTIWAIFSSSQSTAQNLMSKNHTTSFQSSESSSEESSSDSSKKSSSIRPDIQEVVKNASTTSEITTSTPQNENSHNSIVSNVESIIKPGMDGVVLASLTTAAEFPSSSAASQQTIGTLIHNEQPITASVTETSIHVTSNVEIESTNYTSYQHAQNATQTLATKKGTSSSSSVSETPSVVIIGLPTPAVPTSTSSSSHLHNEHVVHHVEGNGDRVKPLVVQHADFEIGTVAGSNLIQGGQNPDILNGPIGVQGNFESSGHTSSAVSNFPEDVSSGAHQNNVISSSNSGTLLPGQNINSSIEEQSSHVATNIIESTNPQGLEGNHVVNQHHNFSSEVRSGNSITEATKVVSAIATERVPLSSGLTVNGISQLTEIVQVSAIGNIHTNSQVVGEKTDWVTGSGGQHAGQIQAGNSIAEAQTGVESYGSSGNSNINEQSTSHISAISGQTGILGFTNTLSAIPGSSFQQNTGTTNKETSAIAHAEKTPINEYETVTVLSIPPKENVNTKSSIDTVSHHFVTGDQNPSPSVSEQINAEFVLAGSKGGSSSHATQNLGFGGTQISQTSYEMSDHSTVHHSIQNPVVLDSSISIHTSSQAQVKNTVNAATHSNVHNVEASNEIKFTTSTSGSHVTQNETVHAPSMSGYSQEIMQPSIETVSHNFLAGSQIQSPSASEQINSEFGSSGSKGGSNSYTVQDLGIGGTQITQTSFETSGHSTAHANPNSNAAGIGILHEEQKKNSTLGSMMLSTPKPEIYSHFDLENRNSSKLAFASSTETMGGHIENLLQEDSNGDRITSIHNLAHANVQIASIHSSSTNQPQDVTHSSGQISQSTHSSSDSPLIVLPIGLHQPITDNPTQIGIVQHTGDQVTSTTVQGNLHHFTGGSQEEVSQNFTETAISGAVQTTQNTIVTQQKSPGDLFAVNTPLDANIASTINIQSTGAGSIGIQTDTNNAKGTSIITSNHPSAWTHSSQIATLENLFGAGYSNSGQANQPVLSENQQLSPQHGKPFHGMPISLPTISDFSHFQVSGFESHNFNRIPRENLIMISAEYFISLLQHNKCDALKQLIPILQRPMSGIILSNTNSVH